MPGKVAGSWCCSTLKIRLGCRRLRRLRVRVGQPLITSMVNNFPWTAHSSRSSLSNLCESTFAVLGTVGAKVLLRFPKHRVTTKILNNKKTKDMKLMKVEAPTAATVMRGPDAPVEPPLSDPSREWRILAVDDDEDTQFLYARVLARAGYNVTAVADGEEAWTALLTERFDLLLADQNMPRLCGLDLVARMRAAGMTLPVIINSGCLDLREAAAYPHLGLAAVLHKSFRFTELLNTVRHILPLPSAAEDTTVRTFSGAATNAQAAGLST